ncbi:hypothetical protein ACFLTH_10845 [Bacteroidota bacterium]
MKIGSFIYILIAILLIGLLGSCSQTGNDDFYERLKVSHNGDSKIEVGGPYVGIEIHHSSPLLQRISFFYPVANSIDLSTDYWTRDTSHIMTLGLKIGDDEKQAIGLEPLEYELTPYNVSFHKKDSLSSILIKYQFCNSKPAMVISFKITNEGDKKKHFEFYTGLETLLRTCHTFAVKEKAWTEYNETGSTIFTNFEDPETKYAQVFVANAGEIPTGYDAKSNSKEFSITDNTWNNTSISTLPERTISKEVLGKPAAKYIYNKELEPGESLTVVQIIGSCKMGEGYNMVDDLLQNYKMEVDAYENFVLEQAYSAGKFITKDSWLDKTYNWARGVLAVNKHFLDDDMVPMPCPAEYNFYFTHDVLVTDLSAVNYDLKRVKNDLLFLKKHSNSENVIPHAYYWKDDKYVTEYSALDSWNHFWFIITCASYLRHSGDNELLMQLYPYITKSLEQTLTSKMDDDLMWAYRPEGWDIGSSFGPRSFMTILAVRAIRDYLYISTLLNINASKMGYYETLADRMNKQLIAKLWSDEQKYLINYYEDGSIDTHYYSGSLLAAHFRLLDGKKLIDIAESAKGKLLDTKLGIYNVYPMDFHLLIDFLKFKGNEAGDPFLYANGGIWPQANIWYALTLIATDQKDDAFNFIKNVMTIEGIMNSPNGQPAMYEYRCGNYNNPKVYGTIDKPQFTWAAGWYIYGLYHLFGINENEWNISFDPYLAADQNKTEFDLNINGSLIPVKIYGSGDFIESIKLNGKEFHSAVIPSELKDIKNIEIKLGMPVEPYLKNVKSILNSVNYNKNKKYLDLNLSAFTGYMNEIEVISRDLPKNIVVGDDQEIIDHEVSVFEDAYVIKALFVHKKKNISVVIKFD